MLTRKSTTPSYMTLIKELIMNKINLLGYGPFPCGIHWAHYKFLPVFQDEQATVPAL